MLRKLLVLCVVLCLAIPAQAGRDILIVTPQGVFLVKMVDGVPHPPVVQELDVIVQDLVPGGGPVPPVIPDPPATDPVVIQIAAISKATLKDAAEGTAAAAIVSSLSKLGLTGDNFKEALLLAAPIADTSLQAEGRINKWVKDATAVSSDPAKLRAGLMSAFGITAATLETIHSAAVAPAGAAVTGEALNWTQIIEIIQLIIQLLKNLGILGG